MNNTQTKALNILKDGGIIAYPTDTTYGIGCDATQESAVKRIFLIKGRNWHKPLSIACDTLEMVNQYTDINQVEKDFLDSVFPGPVTVLLNKKESLPDSVTAGSSKVGVRIPDYQEILEVINALHRPIITTSANISGQADPCSAEEISPQISKQMDLIYPGDCQHCQPSTIIDLESCQIVRRGVNVEYYQKLLGKFNKSC